MKNNILECIGRTPCIMLKKLSAGLPGTVAVKLESKNPAGSVKDRIALAMIEVAEEQGLIRPGTTIIEPTSGNTGIGLAFVAAVKGYPIILTMPDSMSIERRKLLKAYGAQIVLTEGKKGMKGAIEKALELAEEHPQAFIPQQFKNPANPAVHVRTTAVEIWEDTEGAVDCFVAGVGTGGTISGVGKRLKSLKPTMKIVAVEPADSPVLSGGPAGPHKIQGIGAGFIPEILETDVIDEIIKVETVDAIAVTKALVKEEGILAGISSGANVWSAIQIASKIEFKDKLVVTIICDSGERYISTDIF